MDTMRSLLPSEHRHRQVLDFKGRDYYFGNASFFDSVYKVFEMQRRIREL